jgi:hypothetical protein
LMPIEILVVVAYAVLVLVIATRIDRPRKKNPRITGRGGDFE